MHPQIIRDQPGQCPICGMDLVPTSEYGYANQPVPQAPSLYVPRAAVLLAGGNSVVYVETEPGRFEIRPVTVGPILRNTIVILEGLQAGEKVATSGNFLIDSQMQLAGKPSVIDPTRAIAKKNERTGPLAFDKVSITAIGGPAGEKLESLYAAYFDVQRALASDQKPPPDAAQALAKTAGELSTASAIPQPSRTIISDIATSAEHLHHMDLAGARTVFKPISHAVVTLATQLRSQDARQPFTHFYCPMVPGGGGDWLQPGGEPANPYFGSQMPHCGEKAAVIPVQGPNPSQPNPHEQHGGTQAPDKDS
jgi:Cu(I)/Ag(I) efflux system membrane fusion protein